MAQINFPKDAANILLSILETHNLKETDEEIFAKFQKGFETNNRKIAKILIAIKEDQIPLIDLPAEITKQLKIPQKQAREIAKEIQNKIFRVQPEKQPQQQKQAPEPIKIQRQTKPPITYSPNEDAYREPLL